MDKYDVVFSGEITDGHGLEQVRESLTSAFKITDESKIEKLFSGSRVVLRRGLTRGDAWKFKQKLEGIGAVTELEQVEAKEDSAWLSFDQAPESASAANTAPKDSTPPEPRIQPSATSLAGLSLEPIEDESPAEEEAPAPQASVAFHSRDVGNQSRVAEPVATAAESSPTAGLSSGASLAAAQIAAENSNSSGSGGDVTAPPNASGLCWGGFFLGWIWAVFNRSWIGLLGLVPFLSLPVAILLLFKGRDWAWKNKRWDSVEHFNEVQRKWSIAGLVIVVVGGLLWIQLLNDISEFSEAEAMQMEEQRQELRDRLDTIEDPEQRKQLEALIEFQEQIQKQLEESG